MREETIVILAWFGMMFVTFCVAIWYLNRPDPSQRVLEQAIAAAGAAVVASVGPTRMETAQATVSAAARPVDPTQGTRPLIYMACPYTSTLPEEVEARVRAFAVKAGEIERKQQVHIVSPVLNHLVLQHAKLPSDWEYWRSYSLTLLTRCDGLYVLRLPGWATSTGVTGEIAAATEMKIPITYLDP
ncbi:MAG: DUF1937 family protein [Verrucomicrobiaceae bacterium]|nr:MAG: DUF1937 family protein [Verrucomicrobiaceae bacterium]